MAYQQAKRFLALKTPLGEDVLLLTDVRGTEGVSQLFQFELETFSTKHDIAAKDILGKAVSFRYGGAGATDVDRWTHGIVRSFAPGAIFDGERRTYHLEVVPRLWLLTQRTNIRIFQQQTTKDIVTSVLSGMPDVTFNLQGTFEKRNYCVQYRETDFEFVSRLLEEDGIYYFFEHAEGKHELVFANSLNAWPNAQPAKLDYRPELGGGNIQDAVTSWAPRYVVHPGKWTLWDHNFQLPHQHLEASKPSLSSIANVGSDAKFERYDHPGFGDYGAFDGVDPNGGDQASELQKIFQQNKRIVGLRMEEDDARHAEFDGASRCASLVAGTKLTINKLPDLGMPEETSFVLLSMRHDASDHSYTGGDSSYSNSFVAALSSRQWLPPRRTPRPRVYGPQTAVVVGPSGEEIFTDKYGRVKVQFHWDREGKNDAASSCWLRVAQMWAGKQWGAIFIPRIGMEVVVDFLEGDPDRPLITGCVYNGDFMPPYALPDNKTQTGLKTRSTTKGTAENFNELRFEDKKGSEEIYFHGEKDFNRVVENNDTLKVGSDKADDGSQTIEIWKDRTTAIKKGNEKLTVEEGNRTTTVSKGDETHDVTQGKRTVSVNGDDSYTVKTGNRTMTVSTGNDTHEIKTGNRAVTVDMGNDTLTIKMGNHTTKVNLGSSSTEAMQSIELKVGGNSVKIDQTGVTIQGIMVKVQGQAQAQIQAPMTQVSGDGMLTLKGGITMIG